MPDRTMNVLREMMDAYERIHRTINPNIPDAHRCHAYIQAERFLEQENSHTGKVSERFFVYNGEVPLGVPVVFEQDGNRIGYRYPAPPEATHD